MWIKSLYDDTWVSMKHVTHFKIESDHEPMRRGNNFGYAYLDTGSYLKCQRLFRPLFRKFNPSFVARIP